MLGVAGLCSSAVAETLRWRWVGDRAMVRTFDDPDIADANRAAVACARALSAIDAVNVEDVVPGARSVLVVLRPGATPANEITSVLDRDRWDPDDASAGRTIEIPARYGGDDGPDLAEVAHIAGMAEDEAVAAHASVTYAVGFVGFSPGFAYLLGLDRRLVSPRLDTPRGRVPPGSIGIGGAYTGIYPRPTPGGWRLIGRTDVELFDPARERPALLAPGDRVRFRPA